MQKASEDLFWCFKCQQSFVPSEDTVYCPNCKQNLRKKCVICHEYFLKDSSARVVCYKEPCLKLYGYAIGIGFRYWKSNCKYCKKHLNSEQRVYCCDKCSEEFHKLKTLVYRTFEGKTRETQLLLLELLGKDYLHVLQAFEDWTGRQVTW